MTLNTHASWKMQEQHYAIHSGGVDVNFVQYVAWLNRMNPLMRSTSLVRRLQWYENALEYILRGCNMNTRSDNEAMIHSFSHHTALHRYPWSNSNWSLRGVTIRTSNSKISQKRYYSSLIMHTRIKCRSITRFLRLDYYLRYSWVIVYSSSEQR